MDTRIPQKTATDGFMHKPIIGVSACLLGKPVRFDGGHKNNKMIVDDLSRFIKLVSVCPEMEAGLPTPRPAMRLRRFDQGIRLLVNKTPFQDMTACMTNYAANRVQQLSHLDGFIFKKDSPSCGAFRVPVVINNDGYRQRDATGLFAQAFMQHNPLIPVEEEGRLNDNAIRENFFERIYAYQRWKKIKDPQQNVQSFIEFHSRHKLMLMGRGSAYYQELGRMVAQTTRQTLAVRREAYISRFMQVMALRSQPGRQVNVLQHIMGYLKKDLSSEDKQELLSVFDAYRERQIPLVTPVTLLRHHLRVYPKTYINQQYYLDPFPRELALRSVF